MLAWDFFWASLPGDLIISTPEPGDTAVIKVDPQNGDILFDGSNTGNFVVTGAKLNTLTGAIKIDATGFLGAISDNTTLIVDNGPAFFKNIAFTYDGGLFNKNSSMTVLGRPSVGDDYILSPPGGTTGTLEVDESTALPPFKNTFAGTYINMTGTLTLDSKAGGDALKFKGGLAAESMLITGTTAKEAVVAPALAKYSITYAGFASLDFDLGDGDDSLELIGTTLPVKIDGGAGDDLIKVTGTIGAPIDVIGGADNNTLVVQGTTGNDAIFVDSQAITGTGATISYSALDIGELDINGLAGDDDLTIQMPQIFPAPFPSEALPALIVFLGDDISSNGNDQLKVLGTSRNANSLGADTVDIGDFGTGVFQVVKVESIYVNTFSGDDTITNETLLVDSLLIGGDGDDSITGGGGDDILIGGDGLDNLTGDNGADRIFSDQDETGKLTPVTGETLDGGGDLKKDIGVGGNYVAQFVGDIDDVDTFNGFNDVTGEEVAFTIDPANPTQHLYQPNRALLLLEQALRTPVAVRALGPAQNVRGQFAQFDSFVARGYFSILNRTVEADALAFWVDAHANGLTFEQFQASLFASDEYRSLTFGSNSSFVREMYNDVLHRFPTTAEVTRDANRLQAGVPRYQVALDLINTAEALDVRVADTYNVMTGKFLAARPAKDDNRDAIVSDIHGGLSIEDAAALMGRSNGDYLKYVVTHNATNVGFVGRLYNDVVNRNFKFSITEVTFWSNQLASGFVDRERLTSIFFNSVEKRSQNIDSFYRAFLGRAADKGGTDFWLGRYAAGLRTDEVSAAIIGSNEYFQKAGGTSDGFVRSLYTKVLKRPTAPSQAEIDFWIAQLAVSKRTAVQARSDVALGFEQSDEFRVQLVDGWFQKYLGRSPTDAEQLDTLDALRVGFTQEKVQGDIVLSRGFIV